MDNIELNFKNNIRKLFIFNVIVGVVSLVIFFFADEILPDGIELNDDYGIFLACFIAFSIPSLFWLIVSSIFKKIPDFIFYTYITIFACLFAPFFLFVFLIILTAIVDLIKSVF
ncbi:MAG: hypothetical protein R3Y50_02885 [Rikenellaceae bacterium]